VSAVEDVVSQPIFDPKSPLSPTQEPGMEKAGLKFEPVAGKPALAPMKHDHHHQEGIVCACGHDHSGEEGHSHSGVGLDFQLTVLLPLSIASLVLACVFYWLNGGPGTGTGETGTGVKGDLTVANLLGLLATAIAGGPIIWSAIKGLAKGKTNVNELVAMSIIGAIALEWYVEAGLVALILQIGALIEGVATESAQKAVAELQKLAPKHARVRRERAEGGNKRQEDVVIGVEELREGDILVVMPGERIAADGRLVGGTTSVDESSVTGEAVPVDKGAGSEMLAGTINLTGSVEVEVERVGEHSALGQTIALVRRAQRFQPEIIRAADKFFAFYTPIILAASVIAWLVTKDPVRMVAMWVVGCPCAMLLASPLAIVVSLARASRNGIQVKAGPFVEASAGLETVVFDKTGTLTTGKFIVSDVQPLEETHEAKIEKQEARSKKQEGLTEAQLALLAMAATIEARSSHPLARSIVAYARERGVALFETADVQVMEGLGVRARINGQEAVAGSAKIVPEEYAGQLAKLDRAEENLPVVPVYVVVGGKLMGAIYLMDEIRPEAAKTIARLRSLGIRRAVMLTGDRRRTAELVARAVGCDEVFAELLPGQKVEIVRDLQRGGKAVCMVGDGINDAPSLATATVGVAMGVRGTDVAIEAADAVLLKDDLSRLPLLVYLAQRTRTAIYMNLGIAVVFAGAAEFAAAAGFFGLVPTEAQPIVAAVVHILGVVVIAMNSVRLAGGHARRTTTPTAEEEKEAPAKKKYEQADEWEPPKLTRMGAAT
jgi:Zn2+/Cd2+-exporting ATPase